MTTAGGTVNASTCMLDDVLDALLARIDHNPQMDPDGPFAELFLDPTETLHRLGVFADRGADGNVTLRPSGKLQSARQRLRTRKATQALQRAHKSFLRRMDDHYPDDVDYANASARFVDLLVRALDGDQAARAEAAEYLGVDTDAVFALIGQLDRDATHDRDALTAAITRLLALAATTPRITPVLAPDVNRDVHLTDVTRSVAPVNGPTAIARRATHPVAVLAAATRQP